MLEIGDDQPSGVPLWREHFDVGVRAGRPVGPTYTYGSETWASPAGPVAQPRRQARNASSSGAIASGDTESSGSRPLSRMVTRSCSR